MKICLISPLFEPWNTGGDTEYINNLAQNLSKEHEVVVITTTGPEKRIQNKTKNFKIFELRLANVVDFYSYKKNPHTIDLGKRIIWHILDMWNISYYKQIKKILKIEKPEIVHTNATKGISSSVFAAIKNQKIPHVLNLHDYWVISRWGSLIRFGKPIRFNIIDKIYMNLMRSLTSDIGAVISASDFTLNFFRKNGFFTNSQKFVIPYGIEIKTNVKHKKGVGRDFMYLGRLHKTKGVHILIKAFKKIDECDARLHIVGDGEYTDILKKLAEGDKRIIFHGPRYGKDLDSIFEKCSYGVVPSIWEEVFGYVNLHFMNNGLPVIGSNKGGIPEIITRGNCGIIYPANDVESLRKIMLMLLKNDMILERLSKNALMAIKNYSVREQVRNIVKVYQMLTN